MNSWILFWKVFFIITLVVFAVMSVWVTIGGYADVIKLFRKMGEGKDKEEDE